jgi:hypothetical protein
LHFANEFQITNIFITEIMPRSCGRKGILAGVVDLAWRGETMVFRYGGDWVLHVSLSLIWVPLLLLLLLLLLVVVVSVMLWLLLLLILLLLMESRRLICIVFITIVTIPTIVRLHRSKAAHSWNYVLCCRLVLSRRGGCSRYVLGGILAISPCGLLSPATLVQLNVWLLHVPLVPTTAIVE